MYGNYGDRFVAEDPRRLRVRGGGVRDETATHINVTVERLHHTPLGMTSRLADARRRIAGE